MGEGHTLKPVLMLLLELLFVNFHLTWQLVETAKAVCGPLFNKSSHIDPKFGKIQNGL